MSEIDPAPTPQQILVSVSDAARRAWNRVGWAQETLRHIEYDHHVDPVERQAVAVLTGISRLAENWRYLETVLGRAEATLGSVLVDLDGLVDDLGRLAATPDVNEAEANEVSLPPAAD
jgi:hypothetical protein